MKNQFPDYVEELRSRIATQKLLTLQEVMYILQIKKATAYKLADTGTLKSKKMPGGRTFFIYNSVVDYVNELCGSTKKENISGKRRGRPPKNIVGDVHEKIESPRKPSKEEMEEAEKESLSYNPDSKYLDKFGNKR